MGRTKKESKFIPTLPDVLAVAGIIAIGYGVFLVKPWLASVVVGSILLLLGLFGHLYSKKVPE